MIHPVLITADSTCDLSPELIERYQIKIIPLTIHLGSEIFLDGINFTPFEMYQRYHKDGTLPQTSAPNIEQFLAFFKQYTSQGYEIVHLDISSDLSSSFSAASVAAKELQGVYTVDSRMLSTGVGLLILEAAECRETGMNAEEIAAHLRSIVPKVDTSFVLNTLEFMWKGGRCSGVAALGANMLRLKPAIEMSDGKLVVYKKYRGTIEQVYRKYIQERLSGKEVRPAHVFLTHSGEIPENIIQELVEQIHTLIPVNEVHVTLAGCTVSSHCGPRTLGVLFIQK